MAIPKRKEKVDFDYFNLTKNQLEFYEDDIWDLMKHPNIDEVENYEKKLKSTGYVFDFNEYKNKSLRKEVKLFLINCVKNRNYKPTTIAYRLHIYKFFLEFVDDCYPSITSIIEIDQKTINQVFIKYLKKRGIQIEVKGSKRVNSDMEIKQYYYKNVKYVYFEHFYNFIYKIYYPPKKIKERDKDVWDVRNLKIKVDYNKANSNYKLNFTKITQDNIKKVLKKYIYSRLQNKKKSTCDEDLKGFRIFSKFLRINYPEIKSLDQLNRNHIENFLSYVENLSYVSNTKRKRIGVVKYCFEYLQLTDWDNKPKKQLFYSFDLNYKYDKNPKIISDYVMEQLNKNLEYLPDNISRMVYIIQRIGMRITELCILKIEDLRKDNEGDYYLRYYQPKTYSYNKVPIDKELTMVIKAAIKDSLNKYGENVEYIFSRNENEPIRRKTFDYHLNQLSYNKKIKDEKGEIYRFRSHRFRSTLATNYFNNGLSMNATRKLLGQNSYMSIRHYAKIFDTTLIEKLSNVLDYQENLLLNIGNEDFQVNEEIKTENNIALPNGSCNRSLSEGKCNHANACYTCSVFKPNKKYLKVYKTQLKQAKANLEMAKRNKFERLKQVNKELVENLNRIIEKVKAQRGEVL